MNIGCFDLCFVGFIDNQIMNPELAKMELHYIFLSYIIMQLTRSFSNI